MRWLSKSILHFSKFQRVTAPSCTCKRFLLTGSYSCDDVWAARLSTPILKKLHVGDFSVKLLEKLDKEGTVSAVDMDILANKLEEAENRQLDFIQSLFYRFHKTREYNKVTAATSHALIRTLLVRGETERLLKMLLSKMEYGMFLDDYTSVMLLDHFIENKNYQEAAVIAYENMLQEDFSNPIVKAMSWYACHMHWKHLTPQSDDTAAAEEKDDDEEVVYKRIEFIERPYYDGHFDIPKDSMKLGKTFTMLSEGRDDLLSRSYRLIGWGLYEQFDKGLQLLQDVIHNDSAQVTTDALESFVSCLEGIETKEPPAEEIPEGRLTMKDALPYITHAQKEDFTVKLQELQQQLKGKNRIIDSNLETDLEKTMLEAVKTYESDLINTQKSEYEAWESLREKLVQEQIAELQLQKKKLAIAERLMQLQAKEEKLQFFENEERIGISVKKVEKVRAFMARQKQEEEMEEAVVKPS